MALDDIFSGEKGKEKLEKSFGKPFGIDPSKGYKKDKSLKYPYDKHFYSQAKDLFDLLENYQKFQQDSNNNDAFGDLKDICAKYLKGSPVEKEVLSDPTHVMDYANYIASQGELAMAKWTEKNLDDVLDEFSAEKLYQIFHNIPLYNKKSKSNTEDKSKSDEHNKIKSLRDKINNIEKDLQKNKGEGLDKILKEDINGYMEEIAKKNLQLARYIQSRGLYSGIKNTLIRSYQEALAEAFVDKEGKKLDKEKIKDYLKENYKIVEEYMKERKEDKIKDKAWNKNLKEQYIILAQELFNQEKSNQKKQDLEDNSDKKDAKELDIKI